MSAKHDDLVIQYVDNKDNETFQMTKGSIVPEPSMSITNGGMEYKPVSNVRFKDAKGVEVVINFAHVRTMRMIPACERPAKGHHQELPLADAVGEKK